MKIAIVNKHANRGGAARAAHRLHDGLRRIGHDSTMFVEHGHGDGVVAYHPAGYASSRIERRLRSLMIRQSFSPYRQTRAQGLEIFSDDRSLYGHGSVACVPDCDMVNFHWVARFINYASIPRLNHIPMVWTLHDMNPFTGGCHYDSGCEKYAEACGECPQLGSTRHDDLSAKIRQRKQAAFSQLHPEKFHVVTPSKWLAAEASRSTLLKRFQVTVIPNSLDTSVFAPRRTDDLRHALDIPVDAQVILFLSDSVENKRKGFQFLLDALVALRDFSKVVLLSVGSGSATMLAAFRHIQIGRVEDERILSMVYSLADVFVIPSVQDNLPNTVMESMACGTPVVGFEIGGIPDMVKDGETGFLAPAGDVGALKSAMEAVLRDAVLRKTMSGHCRATALKEYDLSVQANRYSGLYSSMIQDK